MNRKHGNRRLLVSGSILGAVLIAALILFNLFIKRVDPGYAGVVVDYGSGSRTGHPVIHTISTGSYTLINPFTETLVQYPVGQQTLTMVRVQGEGQVAGDDSVACQDKNGITVAIDSSVLWSVDPSRVGDLYLLRPNVPLTGAQGSDISSMVVRREARNAVTVACTRYSWDEILGPKKAAVQHDAEQILRTSLERDDIVLSQLYLGETWPTQQQADALNAKAVAQQQAQQAAFLAQKATNEANAAIAKANGDKQVAILQAEGQAQSISLIQRQLSAAPAYIQYLYASRWDGHLPATLATNQTSTLLPLLGGAQQDQSTTGTGNR